MQALPWKALIRSGLIYLAAVLILGVGALVMEWIPPESGERIGRLAAIGLVAVWGAVLMRHRRGG